MAVTVARVHLAMANAALPGLLPTPPKSATIPPASACVPIISPAKSSTKSKPGRADAVERWDAHKTRPGSPSPSSSGSSPRSASSSPGRASSCDRWDSNKKNCPSTTSSEKTKCDSSSKRTGTAAERWDLHKKPRAHGDGGGLGMGSDDKKTMDKLTMAIYAGPGFINTPEPCMLPIPAFLVRAS